MANAVQFVAKLIGHVLIGLASIVGALPLVWLLAAMKLGSGLAAVPMNAAPPRKVEGGDEQSQIVRIRDGLRVVHRSAEMFPAILTQAAVGWIGGGIGVIGAILIRDEYAGGAQEFMFITLSFSFGAIVATMSLVRIGEIRRPGRALALSFLVGIAVLLLVSKTQPFVVYCIMVFIWGISAGLMQALARSIIQITAPETHIGRALSVFEMSYLGSLGLGALVMGFVIGALGPRQAALPLAAAMAVLFAYLLLRTTLWRQAHSAADAT